MKKKTEILAFAGAGGKTSVLWEMAGELFRQGKKVLVTTSTHMAMPAAAEEKYERLAGTEKIRYLFSGGTDADMPKSGPFAPVESCILAAGACLFGKSEKFGPLPADRFRLLAEQADYVLVEADGSRRLPLKVPGDHEPAIPDGTGRIFLLAGLSALGKPLGQCCHRAEAACRLTGAGPEEAVTEKTIAAALYLGYIRKFRRDYPDVPLEIVMNQADTEELREAGRRAGELLRAKAGGGKPFFRIWLRSGKEFFREELP